MKFFIIIAHWISKEMTVGLSTAPWVVCHFSDSVTILGIMGIEVLCPGVRKMLFCSDCVHHTEEQMYEDDSKLSSDGTSSKGDVC